MIQVGVAFGGNATLIVRPALADPVAAGTLPNAPWTLPEFPPPPPPPPLLPQAASAVTLTTASAVSFVAGRANFIASPRSHCARGQPGSPGPLSRAQLCAASVFSGPAAIRLTRIPRGPRSRAR